jgi:hypothetical protein
MENRDNLLAEINAVLAGRKLKAIPKLGLASANEIEITGIHAVYDHSERFFTDIQFDVLFPNGKPGLFTVRFNANGAISDGSVIALMVNGKFAVIKQWRVPLGRWTTELPRGFTPQFHAAREAGNINQLAVRDLPIGIVARELGEDLMAGAKIVGFTELGTIAENSGTSAVSPTYDLIQLEVDPAKLAARTTNHEDGGLLALRLWSPKTLRTEMGGKLADNHSITGASLALAALDRQRSRK